MASVSQTSIWPPNVLVRFMGEGQGMPHHISDRPCVSQLYDRSTSTYCVAADGGRTLSRTAYNAQCDQSDLFQPKVLVQTPERAMHLKRSGRHKHAQRIIVNAVRWPRPQCPPSDAAITTRPFFNPSAQQPTNTHVVITAGMRINAHPSGEETRGPTLALWHWR